jgi:hypothetical protein
MKIFYCNKAKIDKNKFFGGGKTICLKINKINQRKKEKKQRKK